MSDRTIVVSALSAWNALAVEEAEAAVLPCNGSQAWSRRMSAGRPYATAESVFLASDNIWRSLAAGDWQEAFDSHPRLGGTQAKAASGASLRWSAGEQSALQSDEGVKIALAVANEAYEARFGRIFLACATGRSAAEILALLQRRMNNTPEAEVAETAEQQRRITQLRLRKWLRVPAAGCDDV